MSSKLFECPICYIKYDRITYLPKVIPCGHTLCSPCLAEIIKSNPLCPIGRETISTSKATTVDCFPMNLFLLQQLEETVQPKKDKYSVCNDHGGKKQNFVCMTDQKVICKYCHISCHQDHTVRHIGEIKTEIAQKKDYLDELLRNFDDIHFAIPCDFAEKQRKELAAAIQEKFGALHTIIRNKEQEILTDLEDYVIEEKKKIEEKWHQNSALNKEIQTQIAMLSRETIDKYVLETLNEDINESFKTNNEITKSLTEDFEKFFKNFDFFWKDFSEIVTSMLETFKSVRNTSELAASDSSGRQNEDQVISDTKIQVPEPVEEEVKIDEQQLKNLLKLNNSPPKEARRSQEIIYSYPNHVQNSIKGFMQDGRLTLSPTEKNEPRKRNLSDEMREWRGVGKVTLNFSKLVPTKDCIHALSVIWEDLGDIIDLKLDFSNRKLVAQELALFSFQNFWASHTIQVLEIDMKGSKRVGKTPVDLIKPLDRMKNLRSITMGFTETPVTDDFIDVFRKNIAHSVKSLECLQLILANTFVTDQSFQQLSSLLYGARNIKTLALSFAGIKIKEPSIKQFVTQTIPAMENLENFTLILSASLITNNNIDDLCYNMRQSAKGLRTFKLDLCDTKITDHAIEALAWELVPLMHSLHTFQLHLSSTHITDKSLQLLFKNMTNVAKNLKKLRIDVPVTKISDASINAFTVYTLPTMKELRDFEFRLAGNEVSDGGVIQLCRGMESNLAVMKKLHHFGVTLGRDQVSSKTERILHDFRKKLPL